jgi:hypothetical protein
VRKRLKRRPASDEGYFMPRRPLPPRLERRADGSYQPPPQPRREYKQVSTGGSGDGEPPCHFAKGQGHPGRPKGSPNKLSRLMRECAILAAEDCKHANGKGLYGYLLYIATKYPTVYARSILAKLIPYNVNLHGEMRLQSADEIRSELRARGIPVPDHLFEVPRIPSSGPTFQRRPDPAPAPEPEPDEDGLAREEPPPAAQSEPPIRRYDNPYSVDRPPAPPYVPGPLPVNGEPGSQLDLPWGGGSSNMDLHCWTHGPKPPRLVVSNNEEPADDQSRTSKKSAK